MIDDKTFFRILVRMRDEQYAELVKKKDGIVPLIN